MEVNKYENTQDNVIINREQSKNKSAEKNAAVVQLFCFLCNFVSPRRSAEWTKICVTVAKLNTYSILIDTHSENIIAIYEHHTDCFFSLNLLCRSSLYSLSFCVWCALCVASFM